MKWLDIVKFVAPLALNLALPKSGAVIADAVVKGIDAAEQLPGATSAEKRAHAVEIVTAGIHGVNAAAGKVVVDPTIALDAVGQSIDTTLAITKLVQQLRTPQPAPVA